MRQFADTDALGHPYADLRVFSDATATARNTAGAGPSCCAAPRHRLTFGHWWGPERWHCCQCGAVTKAVEVAL